MNSSNYLNVWWKGFSPFGNAGFNFKNIFEAFREFEDDRRFIDHLDCFTDLNRTTIMKSYEALKKLVTFSLLKSTAESNQLQRPSVLFSNDSNIKYFLGNPFEARKTQKNNLICGHSSCYEVFLY